MIIVRPRLYLIFFTAASLDFRVQDSNVESYSAT